MTFYENRLACATIEEIKAVVKEYCNLYPKFDVSQPTIEEYISWKECQRLDEGY
jgi:hypothetical protein